MAATNLGEFRGHIRGGSLNIPPPPPQQQHQQQQQQQLPGHSNGMMPPMPPPPTSAAAVARFDGSRSPPNTSHVPCKFFRQGACQAGNACPFSHDLSTAAENVCKYFAKGNCKFGPKCANIHVLPDGRRINYGKNGVTIGQPAGVALGARVNPTTYHPPASSALTTSFMRADSPYNAAPPPYGFQEERYNALPPMENGLPTIDTTYSSNPASAYGSPRDEDMNRFGLGLSPVNVKGLSVLDAPLPASFDSNGISHAARYGPWPASVPSKFGLESPSPSLSAAKISRTSDALKLLHTSAFGNSEHLSPSMLGGTPDNFGSSPPAGAIGSALVNDEYFGKRQMHSSSMRFAKTRIMSSSVPKIDRDWDPEFLFEEDYIPGTLANEVLTPQEKARRGSNTNTIRMMEGVPMDSVAESCPPAVVSKFGSSPIPPSSPGRWSIWNRQKDEEGYLDATRSVKHSSAFGHVGSPLRNSSLASAITSALGKDTGDMGGLTEQLRETQLSDDGSVESSPHLRPKIPRNTTNGAGVIGESRDKDRSGLERHISSNSIGSNNRFRSDEEEGTFVFSMDEDPEETQARARKRVSGGGHPLSSATSPLGAASPLSSAWSNSYATVVASNRGGPGAAAGTNGNSNRGGAGAVETVGGR